MTTHFTLAEILEAQAKHEEPLPSLDDIQQSVLSLISRHQNPDKVLLEVLTSVGSEDLENAHDCVDDVIDQLRHNAELSDIPFGSHSASWCASHLAKLLSINANSLLMEDSLKKKVMVIVDVVKKCMASHGLNRNLFVRTLNKKLSLSAEMVWILHNRDIMPLDLYFTYNHGNSDIMKRFSSGLENLSHQGDEATSSYRQNVLNDCLGYLATHAYGDSSRIGSEKDIKKTCISVLDSITQEFLCNLEKTRDVSLYEGALEALSEDTKNLQKFATRHLTLVLGHDPNIPVSKALSDHTDWGFAKTPSSLKHAFAQLMLVFKENEVIEIFQQFLEEQEVNWKTVLAFVSTFLICYKGAAPVLQELICKYLQEGLDDCDLEGVILAFLLARHASSEGPHVFMTYAQWFQTTFSDSSQNPASSKKTFSFLIKFLTDIMPFERAEFLKVHLTKPPFVPDKCRPLMSDYVTLAKTRLMDLKDPLENLGIYEETGAGDSELAKIDSDVEKAIAGFSKTGKVPLTIMEASMFRKPYYMGRFLPALLKPRPLPDDPDDRMNFIEALWQANKIPVNLYNNYTKACKKESTQLLEGMFSDADDSMDEMVLEPFEQLANSIDKFKENVLKEIEDPAENTISGDISMIADKMQLVLSSANVPKIPWNTRNVVSVDVDVPVVEPAAVQVVDLLLNCICELTEATEKVTWLTKLYLTVTQHKSVLTALIVRLWDLLIIQAGQIEQTHLNGLTAVLIHMFTCHESEQSVDVVYNKLKRTLQEHFVVSLNIRKKEEMHYMLRFLVTYLSQAFSRFNKVELPNRILEPVVPLQFVKMFTFLANRMLEQVRTKNTPGGQLSSLLVGGDILLQVSAVHASKQFAALLQKTTRWSLLEWMEIESSIDPRCDILDSFERYSYHRWFLLKYHLHGNADVNFGDLAKEIFLSLLELEYRNNAVKPGQPDLVKLLSELLSPTLLASHSATDNLWIYDCFSSWINHVEDPSEMNMKSKLFLRELLELPHHLLFTNDLMNVKQSYRTCAVTLINDTILDNVNNGAVLDLKTLSYILQGLASLSHHGHDNYVRKVMKECPCITVAIMIHWEDILSHLKIMFRQESSYVFVLMGKIQKVLDYCRSNFPISLIEGSWLEGLGLFRASLIGEIDADTVSGIVSDLVSASHMDILETWMTFNLCHLAHLNLQNQDTRTSLVKSVMEEVVRSCPIGLRALKGISEPPVPNKVLPGPLTRVLPFSLARVFTEMEHQGRWQDALRKNPHLLQSLLMTHSACVKLYHNEMDEASSGLKSANAGGDIADLSSLVEMISHSIKICQSNHVSEIPEEVFKDCDYAIQMMLKKKLPGYFN